MSKGGETMKPNQSAKRVDIVSLYEKSARLRQRLPYRESLKTSLVHPSEVLKVAEDTNLVVVGVGSGKTFPWS